MRRTKETQTFDMDGEQVEIDISGEGGKMLAELLRGGGKRKIVSKRKLLGGKSIKSKVNKKRKSSYKKL